jgi:nucleoside-diphosphate-sugar epimerase
VAERTTIFLTGAGGYVAGALKRAASGDPSIEVSTVARGATPDFRNDDPATKPVLIHLAWPDLPTASDRADKAPAENWRRFVDWSADLRRAADRQSVRFIGIGSGLELHAGDPRLKDPYQTYARRKADLKAMLAEGREPLSWVRLHFMFGPGERPSRIVPAAIQSCLAGETLTCGSVARRRRWLHVDDQARFMLDFARVPLPGEWDVAGREDLSFRDLLMLIGQAVGRPLKYAESNEATPDSGVETLAPARMAPNVPEDAGVKQTLAWRLQDYARAFTAETTVH